MPIELEDVSFTYGMGTPFETIALRGVDLRIAYGEFIGIMGHTGCGKSTLIQLIAGLLAPTGGRVTIDGDDINARGYPLSDLRQRLSIIFQYPDYQLFGTTVEKDVAFSLKHSGLPAREIQARVCRALESVGFSFEKIRGLSPVGLSGGEKRRVAIAGALITEPRILILDEPVAGLDPIGRGDFLRLISGLNQGGVTILMVSHNVDVLGDYAERILVLDRGGLIMDGPTRTVFSDVEKLEELRLGVCRPRKIAHLLEERGVQFRQDIVSYEDLLGAIVKRWKSVAVS
jgi:energy-coupling factor transport system ATP-binding protein